MGLSKLSATRFDKVLKSAPAEKAISMLRRVNPFTPAFKKSKPRANYDNMMSQAEGLGLNGKEKLSKVLKKRYKKVIREKPENSKSKTPIKERLEDFRKKKKVINNRRLRRSHEKPNLTRRDNPEEYVQIEHGGTKQFINDSLKGNRSYPLERGGRGIQVHPLGGKGEYVSGQRTLTDGTKYYADKASTNGDAPARLTGKIKAKYLDSGRVTHEGAITKENIRHLQDIEIKNIPFKRKLISGTESGNRYIDLLKRQD